MKLPSTKKPENRYTVENYQHYLYGSVIDRKTNRKT
jgi:hypothetical protein